MTGSPASAAGTAATRAWARLSPAERLVLGGGYGVALVYLVGVVLRVIVADSSWLIAALTGATAATLVLLPSERRSSLAVPVGALVLGSALATASVTVLEGFELAFDFAEDLEDGGPLFVAIVVLAAVAGIAALVGAVRLGPASLTRVAVRALRAGSTGERAAVAGGLLFAVGWLLMVTVGVFSLELRGSLVIAGVALALVPLLAAAEQGWRIPAAWVAAGGAAVAALVGLALFVDFLGEAGELEAGLDLTVPYLVMVGGLVVFVVGVALHVLEARRAPVARPEDG